GRIGVTIATRLPENISRSAVLQLLAPRTGRSRGGTVRRNPGWDGAWTHEETDVTSRRSGQASRRGDDLACGRQPGASVGVARGKSAGRGPLLIRPEEGNVARRMTFSRQPMTGRSAPGTLSRQRQRTSNPHAR